MTTTGSIGSQYDPTGADLSTPASADDDERAERPQATANQIRGRDE